MLRLLVLAARVLDDQLLVSVGLVLHAVDVRCFTLITVVEMILKKNLTGTYGAAGIHHRLVPCRVKLDTPSVSISVEDCCVRD